VIAGGSPSARSVHLAREMMLRSVAVLALLLSSVACSRQPKHGGTRAAAKDTHCGGELPYAYDFREFPSQEEAERVGCGVKRVYRGVPDPKTGAIVDDEIWVVCCR
jgi:hypothetical protein